MAMQVYKEGLGSAEDMIWKGSELERSSLRGSSS